jgi:hypothetical protein
MFTQSSIESITRPQMVNSLARIRVEWEQAADGNSLVQANASVGLLLADLSIAIGLTPDEQAQALGEDLVNELQDVLISIPENIVSI